MAKEPRTVHFERKQIDAIEDMERSNPTMRGRGFGWVVRWLINKAVGFPNDIDEKEEQDNENS